MLCVVNRDDFCESNLMASFLLLRSPLATIAAIGSGQSLHATSRRPQSYEVSSRARGHGGCLCEPLVDERLLERWQRAKYDEYRL
jgi:hypothetical protein